MHAWIRLLIVTVIATAVAAPAMARPRNGARVAQADRRDKVKKKLRTMRAYVLTDELGLDEATAAKLFPILADYDDEFEAVAKAGVALRTRAREAADKGDDKALDTIIDEVVANQRKRWELDEARFKKLRKVLTTRQAARILVVLPEIDRKILQGGAQGRARRRARARGQARRPAGQGRQGGEGQGQGQGRPGGRRRRRPDEESVRQALISPRHLASGMIARDDRGDLRGVWEHAPLRGGRRACGWQGRHAQCKARINIPARTGTPPMMPAIPRPMAAPRQGGNKGDVIDLGDLPAPKRPSPLAGAIPPPPSATRMGAPSPSALKSVEASSLEMDAIDLPAPVGPEPTGVIDLPAPKRAATSPALRQGALEPRSFDDLPAPKRASGPAPELDIIDLPGPRRADVEDLPAPKRASGGGLDGGVDLPAPKGFFDDLPAPKGAHPSVGMDDLLAPLGASPSMALEDLPAPKRPSTDGGVDLPAPKGFFDDLPAPKGAHPSVGMDDLLAPKRASADGGVDLPAPKGFFDDLPAPAGAPSPSDLPAPKGFFDDLPGPQRSGGTVPPPAGGGRGKSLDLDDLDLAPPTQPPVPAANRAAMAAAGSAAPRAIPLELPSDPGVPALELDGPSDRFGGLELPAISPAGTEPAKAAAAAAAEASAAGVSFRAGDGAGASISAPPARGDDFLDLDIEGKKTAKGGAAARPATVAPRPADATKAEDGVEAGARRAHQEARAGRRASRGRGPRRGRLWFYGRMQDSKARAAKIDSSLGAARAQLASGEPGHWARAASAAQAVLDVEPRHAEALGIAAEATLAALLDDGVQPQQRRNAADKLIEALRNAAARGNHVERASALWSLVTGDPDGAIAALDALVAAAPDDADLQLFLAWAHAARRDWAAAKLAYTAAAKAKNRERSATYGIGLAQLELGDLDGARTSFGRVNELSTQPNLGAQIGVAAAMPPAEYARREAELLAILAHKSVAAADPRAIARGWRLAGDDARRAGRGDAARDRYRKALKLDPDDVAAIVGDAELDIAEQSFEPAEASLTRALRLAPGHIGATLARGLLDLERGQLDAAEAAMAALIADPPPRPVDRGRAYLIYARALEAGGKDAAAADAYDQAQQALGSSDIAPTIARATILGRLAERAQQAGKLPEAEQLRTTRSALLAGLAADAAKDPANALTLGRAYQAAGDGVNAEQWLRTALAARPSDVEIRVQLGAALELQGKQDDAIKVLLEAFDLDPSLDGVGTRLAETLEAAGRTEEATTLWDKLLANPTVTIDLRLRAGLFFVRTGNAGKGADQGNLVLTAEPRNPTGLYLKGEGLYAKQKYEEARDEFKGAADLDGQAVYLEAYARASEMLALTGGDSRFDDDALRGYSQAASVDPTMLRAIVGMARLHLKRREYDKAIAAYERARTLSTDHADLAYGLGLAYAGKKDTAKATEWLLRSVKQQPRADAHLALGEIFHDAANPKQAIVHFAAAIRLGRDTERAGKVVPWMEDALWQAGQLERDFGSERAACDYFNEYLARHPTNATKIKSVDIFVVTRCRR